MGSPANMFRSDKTPHCKNGPRLWIKCTLMQMWMLPKEMRFECEDVYERVRFSWRRGAAYYERKQSA